MHVTTIRGLRYENILIRKFNGRKFFDTKISRITVLYTVESTHDHRYLYKGVVKVLSHAYCTISDIKTCMNIIIIY